MEKPRNDMRTLPAVREPDRDGGITLANSRWAALTEPSTPRRQSTPTEARRRHLAPRAATMERESPWQAADRALAEMAAASRDDLVADGKDRAKLERATAAVRDSLLEAAQAAAEASRRAHALAEVLDDALATLGGDQTIPPAVPERAAPGIPSTLSQREREVLSRVAKGRTNKAIAEDLFVSPNTVKTHVASLLRKLDVHTRAQLATIAVQQGL